MLTREHALKHIAYVAVGSNLGNRHQYIQKALKLLTQKGENVLESTSFLYETPPAYVLDQPPFLNAACKIRTSHSPHSLLDQLHEIEDTLGRSRTNVIRFGPRPIDLDILFFDDLILTSPDLTIPHISLAERDFVLGPLHDISPQFIHPISKKTIHELFQSLPSIHLQKVMPIPRSDQLFHWDGPKTYVMGIINITPDSFSDAGDYFDPDSALSCASRMISEGADILDIGSQSTRPTSKLLSAEEELSRLLPVLERLKTLFPDPSNLSDVASAPIFSIDTFHAEVAKAAVQSGVARIINDVAAGSMSSDGTLQVAAEYEVPIVLMHMKGTPQTMLSLTKEDEEGEDCVHIVSEYLKERANFAQEKMGIPRWNIILDPGIGFGKTQKQSLQLLKRVGELKNLTGGYPILIGASRKKFIGRLTGQQEPKMLGWGTAATSSAAVVGGANIVRVHDVKEQKEVIVVADAIFKEK